MCVVFHLGMSMHLTTLIIPEELGLGICRELILQRVCVCWGGGVRVVDR